MYGLVIIEVVKM